MSLMVGTSTIHLAFELLTQKALRVRKLNQLFSGFFLWLPQRLVLGFSRVSVIGLDFPNFYY